MVRVLTSKHSKLRELNLCKKERSTLFCPMLFEAFFVVADVVVVVLVVVVVVVFIYCSRSLIVQGPILAFFILSLEIVWEETHFIVLYCNNLYCQKISLQLETLLFITGLQKQSNIQTIMHKWF